MVPAASSLLVAVLGGLLLVLLPAIGIGALALLIYFVLTKVRSVAGRLVPVVIGLLLAVLAPVVGPFLLPIDAVILAVGVLTPFMAVEGYFPERHRYKILLSCSVVAVSGRLLYGFATAFGGGTGSPVFQVLGSLSSSDAGFLIMNSVALYLEMVIISAFLFGTIFVTVFTFRRLVPG